MPHHGEAEFVQAGEGGQVRASEGNVRPSCAPGFEHLTERQYERLARAIADERHDEGHIPWQAGQELRAVFHQGNPAKGRQIAEKVIASFPSSPIAEIARLGRTLKQWREPFLAYFTTSGRTTVAPKLSTD